MSTAVVLIVILGAGLLAGCMATGWLAGVLIAKACIRRWER